MTAPRFAHPLDPRPRALTLGDGLIFLALAGLLSAGVSLAMHAPKLIQGPTISLSAWALPWYALISTGRMSVAYVFALLLSFAYGYVAAKHQSAGRILIPILDVLQSVPILSFLPVALLSFSALLPQAPAVELSAILLIFTSQTWNLTFSFYQSLTTIPGELREAALVFRFDPWLQFKTVQLPFSARGLVWNSMVSWAGGWFFLMAAEAFTVGARDFRLPGLGAYLQTAASGGDLGAVAAGVGMLIFTLLVLDQFLWRPLLALADKYKLEMVEGEEPPKSWVFQLLSRSWILQELAARVLKPSMEIFDRKLQAYFSSRALRASRRAGPRLSLLFTALLVLCVLYGLTKAKPLLSGLKLEDWARVGLGLLATFFRVGAALLLALLWTVPAGVAIGMSQRRTALLQPVVQVLASIPATALFPVILLGLVHLPGGLNLAAVVLMLLGTQWYLLFNVIAGSRAIPEDLRYTSRMLGLSRWENWRTLLLPALFPYIVTGAITASGGAWNASIVAEHVEFAGTVRQTVGIGSLIVEATSTGNYGLLVASSLSLAAAVVLLNRLFWLRLYRVAEERFKLE